MKTERKYGRNRAPGNLLLLIFGLLARLLFLNGINITGLINKCGLEGGAYNALRWPRINKTATYRNSRHNQECELLPYTSHAQLNTTKINVLMFGDSFERNSCVAFLKDRNATEMKALINSIYPNILMPGENKLQLCLAQANTTVLFKPITGILSENDGRVEASAMGHAKNFVKIKLELARRHYDATHIIFGSFAWDAQVYYNAYCKPYLTSTTNNSHFVADRSALHCVCNETLRKHECDWSVYEQFQKKELPWCSIENFAAWETSYVQMLRLLYKAFPQATVFIRTQPPSSYYKMGNSYCQNHMNSFLRSLVGVGGEGGPFPLLRLLDYHELFKLRQDMCSDGLHYNKGLQPWNDLLMNSVLDSAWETTG